MPRLPRNSHLVTTLRSADNAIRKNTQRDKSKVLRLPRKMTSEVSKVLPLPRKMQRILWKRSKSIAPATQNDFWHIMKHVESATPATRNEAMRRWRASSKRDPFCKTSHRHGHSDLARTVADGCGRLRNVWRTQFYPHTLRVKREPPLCIREKLIPTTTSLSFSSIYIYIYNQRENVFLEKIMPKYDRIYY